MPWDYLQNPILQLRQRIAAHLLSSTDRILEIGAFKTPITPFLFHTPTEIAIVDPLVEPYESHELNGKLCRVRHLAISLDEFDIASWRAQPFGLLFCGMDLNRQDVEPAVWLNTVCKFLWLVSAASPCILEYPVKWEPSAQLFNLILSLLQPRLKADIRLDLTRYFESAEVTDETRSRLYRRMACLADMEAVEKPEHLRERAARILFGSEAAQHVLGCSSEEFREEPRAFDLARYKLSGASISARQA